MKIVFYSFLVFTVAALGSVTPLLIPNIKDNNLKLLVSAGAGLLLGMAFLHMIPEAAHLLPDAFGIWFLVGFLILLILERFVMVHACEEHGCDYHTIGVAAFAGLMVHGVIEGFALASAIMVAGLGPLVLVGILSHKFPAGVALTSILKLAGKKNAQIVAFGMGVSLSVPLGCFIAYRILEKGQLQNSAGILLAISAGTFLYIAACDLLPELHRSDTEKMKRLFAFLFGLLIAFISGPLMGG